MTSTSNTEIEFEHAFDFRRRALEREDVARVVGLHDGALRHHRLQHASDLGRGNEFQGNDANAVAGDGAVGWTVAGCDDACGRLVGRRDLVSAAVLHQHRADRLQRRLEHLQRLGLADRPRGLHGNDAVDARVDDVIHADHVAENGLGGLLKRNACQIENDVAVHTAGLPRRVRSPADHVATAALHDGDGLRRTGGQRHGARGAAVIGVGLLERDRLSRSQSGL